jgi:hypothetical protein
MLKATCCSPHNIGWDFSLADYGGDEIPLIDTGFEMCLRLYTQLTSNFEALFSSRNRCNCPSRSLERRTQKRQSPVRAWKRVHAGRWHAGRSLS